MCFTSWQNGVVKIFLEENLNYCFFFFFSQLLRNTNAKWSHSTFWLIAVIMKRKIFPQILALNWSCIKKSYQESSCILKCIKRANFCLSVWVVMCVYFKFRNRKRRKYLSMRQNIFILGTQRYILVSIRTKNVPLGGGGAVGTTQ